MKFRVISWLLLLLLLLLLLVPAGGRLRAEEFFLQGGERIVFFGDSITQNGTYVNYVEAYLRTRFPDKTFEVISHGKNGETISGATETDHDPPRPHALPRFARDVAAWKPDVVVSCFGMNDGNYHPFEPVRFKKYQTGNRILIRRVKEETKAKLVFLTPPPYDPYRRRELDPEATEFGYKFVAVDYDLTLARYSLWLLTLRRQGHTVFDLHEPMNEHLRTRRKKKVSFTLAPDSIHPSETGHWLMAQQLLTGWNAPREVAVADIDVAAKKVNRGEVASLEIEDETVRFDWTTPLPMPMDPMWDEESIALENVRDRLNVHTLRVVGLKSPKYGLKVDGKTIALPSRGQLEKGLDLTKLKGFPTTKLSDQVLQLVKERRRLVYTDWRNRLAAEENGQASLNNAEAKMLDDKLRKLCQPKTVHIVLHPVPAI